MLITHFEAVVIGRPILFVASRVTSSRVVELSSVAQMHGIAVVVSRSGDAVIFLSHDYLALVLVLKAPNRLSV